MPSRWNPRRCLPWIAALAAACGDDGAGDDGFTSIDAGPDLTTDASQTEGNTNTTGGSSMSTSVSATTDGTDGTGADSSGGASTGESTGATGDSGGSTGFGTDTGGTMVDACDQCAPEELCVELTEIAGPADGGGPMVSYTCHVVPGGCGDTITCACAGHLCPGDGGGAEGMCETDGEVLYCSVAYP